MKKMILALLSSFVMFNSITPFFWQSAVDSMYKDLAEPIMLSKQSATDKIYEIEELQIIMFHEMKKLEYRIENDIIRYHSEPDWTLMVTKPFNIMGSGTLIISTLAFLDYYKSSYTNTKALERCQGSLIFSISAFVTTTLFNSLRYWELKLSKTKLQDLQLFIEKLETLLAQLKKETIAAQNTQN